MVSIETVLPKCLESSSPRISFSSEFLDDDKNFITICPNPNDPGAEKERGPRNSEFEFGNLSNMMRMMSTADELFSEGKLVPFSWQTEKRLMSNLNSGHVGPTPEGKNGNNKEEESRMGSSWFVDDDPSPRPPKCTLLWKELLRLKKQQPLPPNTLLSSSSSSSSKADDERKEGELINKEKINAKRIKKGQDRTNKSSIKIRIRPLITVPIYSRHGKINTTTSLLPPLFPLKKGGY